MRSNTLAVTPFPSAIRAAVAISMLLSLLLALAACGGGSRPSGGQGGYNPPPTTPADFTLAADTRATLTAGSSVSVTLSAAALNGFSSQIAVTVSGLPSGVTAVPATLDLSPGAPQQITLKAAADVQSGNSNITFTGTSGTLKHVVNLTLTLNALPTSNTPLFRTRYVRTDANTQYYLSLNSHWIVYNPPTSRFFVTDPQTNRIHVLDAVTQKKIATITVPGAFGIDDTADHQTLWVATWIGDVYSIDPVTMTVKQRYVASEIGPYGFQALSALVLADGRLALLSQQGGITSVDGSPAFAIWDPISNDMTVYGTGYGMGMITVPAVEICSGMGNIGGFARTPDRKKVVIGSIFSDNTLCSVDAATGKADSVGARGRASRFVISPDGKYIVVTPSYNVDKLLLYDAQSLTEVAEFAVKGDTSTASGLVFGPDPDVLFVPADTIVYAYRLSTRQLVGWLPNIYLPPQAGGYAVGPSSSPHYQAYAPSGLLVGPVEEGVGFLDLATMRTGPVGTQHTNGYLSPATGPVSGGTTTLWSGTAGTLKEIYFGGQKVTGTVSSGRIQATTPAGVAGPADVYSFTTDGGMQLIPEGFSYGPTVLQLTTDRSTVDGGGIGLLYGYGLGPTTSASIPSDLQINVGGNAATVLAFDPNAFGLLSPPFQLETVVFTIPPGTTGRADVSVTTSSGTATQREALEYLPAMQQFALPGSAMAQGIYDQYRDLYYFTDAQKIQVFSRTQGRWLEPIQVPSAQGLWGIALSPDGNRLAVSDISANAIYVLDPSNSSSVKTFSLPSLAGASTGPCGLAISDQGMVYYARYVNGISGSSGFFRLDSNTGAIKDYGITGPGYVDNDAYLRAVISRDNTRVYFNSMGRVFNIDTATDTVFNATSGPGCCYGDYDLALSNNQTHFAATGTLYDSNLNAKSTMSLNLREMLDTSYVYGMKLSPDGTLLFQPSTLGIDVFDGNVGTLRSRISLPTALSRGFDALVSNGKDNTLIAITSNGDGIVVLDLTTLPVPTPLPYSTRIVPNRLAMKQQEASTGSTSRPALLSSNGSNQSQKPTKVQHVTENGLRRH